MNKESLLYAINGWQEKLKKYEKKYQDDGSFDTFCMINMIKEKLKNAEENLSHES